MNFVIATSNKHKIDEFENLLVPHTLRAVQNLDIDEDGLTYSANSLSKLNALVDYGFEKWDGFLPNDVYFADDSGIEVDALDGGPGVLSSRFLSQMSQKEKNIFIVNKVKETKMNRARFVCCISYIVGENARKYQIVGECSGTIIDNADKIVETDHDFGYDPIFIPDGFDKTFNILGKDIKNKISHRAMAVKGMLKSIGL